MREIEVRVDVLRQNVKVTELECVSAPSVQISASAEIKGTMSGEFRFNAAVDWLSDEINPVVIIDGFEHSFGIFAPATYEIDYEDKTVHVEAYDRCWNLKTMTSSRIIHFDAGDNYIDSIISLLAESGISLVNAYPSELAFASDREDWDLGTDYLTIVNTLLDEISYNALWFNEQGYAVLNPKSELDGEIVRTYDFSDVLSYAKNVVATVDMFDVPNVYIAICDNADIGTVWTATAENRNPVSPTSIVRRGKRITAVVKVDNIASEPELQNYANFLAFRQMLLGESVNVTTGLLEYSGINETVALSHPNISGVCRETGWTATLQAGGEMSHILETYSFDMPTVEEVEDDKNAIAGIAIAGIAIAGRDAV